MNILKNILNFLSVSALLLVSTQLQANISPLAFKGIFKHFKPGCELYAPNIGCAALKNGTIDAIRFYNVQPGPNDAQGRPLYIQDKALKADSFAELAILLFPSPAGQLTAMTGHSQSIGAQLSVHDVATLLNFCARVRATVTSSEVRGNSKHYLMGGNEFGSNFAIVIKRLQGAERNQANIDYYKNFLTTNPRFGIIVPRAKELLCLLCKCIELEERDDRRALFVTNSEHYKNFEKYHEATFYPKYTPEMLLNAFFCLKFGSEHIQDLINHLDKQIVDHEVMFDGGLLDQTDFEQAAQKRAEATTLDDLWVMQNRDLFDSVIPYARQCVPVNNGLACGYDRVNNRLLENKRYPDCTETTIRHLCNLVLYNKKTEAWNIGHAQKNISDPQISESFSNFYEIQKPEKANSGEKSIRNAWSKVVNNLDGNIRYNEKFLAHSLKTDNEVDSGLVNIMRVLNIVFNLGFEPEPVYQNNQQYARNVQEWVINGLETLFKALAPEKQNVVIQVTNVATYTAADNRQDCSGEIYIKVGQDFECTLSVGSGHAQFDRITTLAPEVIAVDAKKIDSIAQRYENTLIKSVGEQLLLLSVAVKEKAQTPIHQLFSATIVDSATIIILLKKLYEMVKSNKTSCARTALILQNALQLFLWQDYEMSRNIQPVLKNFFDLKNENIHDILSKEVKAVTGDRWLSDCFQGSIDKLAEFFINLERLSFSWSRIKKLTLSGDNCPELKELDLSWTKSLEEVKFTGTFNELKKINFSASGIKNLEFSGDFPQLTKLDLSSTESLEKVKFAGTFNELKKINLSWSGIKNLTLSGDNCPELTELDLSWTKSLEKVKFTGTFNELKKINFSASGIKNLEFSGDFPELKELDLSSTESLEKVKFRGTFNELKKINFFGSVIKRLELSGDNCPELTELDLSWTKILEEVKFTATFNELKKINLSGSAIKELILDKNAFPKLQTNDPKIKLVDKKRKRDDNDQFEEEVGRGAQRIAFEDEIEQATQPSNANNE